MTPDEFSHLIANGRGAAELPEFIAAGGDVNSVVPNTIWPWLHLACEHQNMDAIRALVAAGANLEARDEFRQTAMHIAVDIDIDAVVQAGDTVSDMQFETTRLLLELGACLDVRDNANRSPRDFAAAYGQEVLDQFDRRTQR